MKKDDKPKEQPSSAKEEVFQMPSLDASSSVPPPAAETTAPAGTPDLSGPTAKDKFKAWFFQNKRLGLFLGFALAGVAMWGISLIRDKDEVTDEEAVTTEGAEVIPVNAVEAHLGRFQDQINAVGTLKGEAEIELRFETDGKIDQFDVSEGAKVRKGQIIARLSDRDAKLKVERAKIEAEQTMKLYQLGGVSKTKLDETRLNLEVAQTELDKTRIVATRDGIIGEKEAEVGEFVNPQRKIAKLVAIKNVIVEVGIIEKQVDKVYPGQKLLVTVDAYPGNIFEGTIETISPTIGPDASKTFSIRSKIPNPDSLLLPGMFARSRIITYEKDDAIFVPNDALVKTSGGFQVFVVNKDNIAEAKDVQVGYVATEFTQVDSGLSPGEVVIVQRPPELKAGNKVKIIEVQK